MNWKSTSKKLFQKRMKYQLKAIFHVIRQDMLMVIMMKKVKLCLVRYGYEQSNSYSRYSYEPSKERTNFRYCELTVGNHNFDSTTNSL